MADQPRNLDPHEIAFGHELEMGMILFIPDYNARGENRTYQTLRFQYNPETVSRTRQGEWTTDRVRGAAKVVPSQDRSLLAGHRGGGLYAKSETISFKLLFDATELMLKGAGTRKNVLPELAFLELIALGGDEPMKTERKTKIKAPPETNPGKTASAPKPTAGNDNSGGSNTPAGNSNKKPSYKTSIQGTAPSELLLVLGPRSFPVVLTSLTINEQQFNPALEPIRAECDCKFRVLEAQEVKHNKPAEVAFTELVRSRQAQAAQATVGKDDDRVKAIVKALEGR
jgi:hypothetical protein